MILLTALVSIAIGSAACNSPVAPTQTIEPLYVGEDGTTRPLADGPVALFWEESGGYAFRTSAVVRGANVEGLRISVRVTRPGIGREYTDGNSWVHLVYDGVDSVPDLADWLNGSAIVRLCYGNQPGPVVGESLTVSVVFGEGESETAPIIFTVVPYCESIECETECVFPK